MEAPAAVESRLGTRPHGPPGHATASVLHPAAGLVGTSARRPRSADVRPGRQSDQADQEGKPAREAGQVSRWWGRDDPQHGLRLMCLCSAFTVYVVAESTLSLRSIHGT